MAEAAAGGFGPSGGAGDCAWPSVTPEAEAAAVVLVRPEVQATVPGHQPRSEA